MPDTPFPDLQAATGFAPIRFDNSYARLPERFYAPREPVPVAAPRLVRLNIALAERLGLDPAALSGPDGVAMLAGNLVPRGAANIALAYAGHQFGHFTPQLGDGRAVLLGEVVAPDGSRHDIQLKGSGPTRFSRRGDGRAGLGPVLREYLVSEAMAALGVPTTRALAAVTTGEDVFREAVLPGAVLTRIAASHIRVGTFQYFAARGDTEALALLTAHAIQRHDPSCAQAPHPVRAFLDGVIARQADLVARWLLVGFIHGVMNTDNTSVSGETIDYGPCAFMDAYDPGQVFSAIDEAGRYAYGEQPRIVLWNLTRLAEALLPLLADDQDVAVVAAQESLAGFSPRFQAAYLDGLRRKLGLATAGEGDLQLAQDLLQLTADYRADFTLTFRGLCEAAVLPAAPQMHALFGDGSGLDAWLARWRARLAAEPGDPAARRAAMQAVNPAYIPRNHQVEAALAAAIRNEDFRPFEALLDVLAHPYVERPGLERYALPPAADELVTRTFCGT